MNNMSANTQPDSSTEAPGSARDSWLRRLVPHGIAGRVLLAVSVIVLTTTLLLGNVVYQNLSLKLIEQQKQLLSHESRYAAMQFSTVLHALRTDALLLVNQPDPAGLARSVMQSKLAYSNIRLLAADGSKQVELQRVGDTIVEAPLDRHNDSLDQGNTVRALGLAAGEVWISDISTTDAAGQPVLQAVTPLVLEQGASPSGSLVITVDIKRLREVLSLVSNHKDLLDLDPQFYISNARGEFISHADRRKTIWHLSDAPAWQLIDEYPNSSWQEPAEDTSVLRIDNARGQSMVLASSAVQLNPDKPGSLRFMLALPYTSILAGSLPDSAQLLVLCLFMACMALLLNAVMTRFLVTPIKQITESIRQAHQESVASYLPTHRLDELGALARTFQNLIDERLATQSKVQQLALAVENAATGIALMDSNGIVRYVNQQYFRQSGRNPNEVIGSPPQGGIDGEQFYQQLWQTIGNGQRWTGVIRTARPDGSILHEQSTIAPMFDTEGRITAYVATLEDITEQRAIADQLQYLAAAIEWADECIEILDATGAIVYLNPAYEKQHGVQLADMKGQLPKARGTDPGDQVDLLRNMRETIYAWQSLARHPEVTQRPQRGPDRRRERLADPEGRRNDQRLRGGQARHLREAEHGAAAAARPEAGSSRPAGGRHRPRDQHANAVCRRQHPLPQGFVPGDQHPDRSS